MNSKFIVMALVVVSASVAFGQTAAPVSPSAPAPKVSNGDIHQKILFILTHPQSRVLLLQIQSQLDAMMEAGADQTQIISLREKIDGMASEYSQLADASAQIELSLGTANTKLDGISDGVGTVSQKVSTVSSEIAAESQSRINDEIEAQLESGKMQANLYIRASQGGRLEMVRDLVSSRASEAESKGWQTDEIKHYLEIANKDFGKQNDHGALSNYRKAYMHIVGKLGHKASPKSWFISTFHN